MRSTDPALSVERVVRSGLCIGCGACAAEAADAGAVMAFDRYGFLKPAGPKAWRRSRSETLARICPFSPTAANEDELAQARFPAAPHQDPHVGRFEAAYVGYAAEGEFRAAGSSGGLVTWTAAELLRCGLVDAVVHVSPVREEGPDARLFRYRISRDAAAVAEGAKSRYYPIDLSHVLQEIRSVPGRYAVVGAPCFIKAVHLARANDALLGERIAYTLGLFCGHMKSARMVESFAWQMGRDGQAVTAIDYRHKDPNRPANWYTARIFLQDGAEDRRDWWSFVDGDWGAGFFQNSACNFCDDVAAETADVAFGDAWLEPYSSDGRGTNVVVARSPVIDGLLKAAAADGRLNLGEVDGEFVRQTQAAGFRQRREGLALRLATRRGGLMPRKRVAPRKPEISRRRWAVYRMRGAVTAWSNRLFFVARRLGRRGIYLRWARTALTLYRAIAWSQGRLGRLVDRLERKGAI